MNYVVTLGDEEYTLEVIETHSGRYSVTLDGKTHEVDAAWTAGEVFSVLVDRRVIEADVRIEPTGDVDVMIESDVFHFHAIDERRKALRASVQGGDRSGTLTSPMPGKVVRILAPAGTQVKAGDGVVIVEAMKMENELTATVDGTVKEVPVKEGDAIDGGAIVAIIE